MFEQLQGEALAAVQRHECPFCGHQGFAQGPRGGLSVNVACPGCGARFNLCGPRAELGAQLLREPPGMARA
jgi:hypothetical protein